MRPIDNAHRGVVNWSVDYCACSCWVAPRVWLYVLSNRETLGVMGGSDSAARAISRSKMVSAFIGLFLCIALIVLMKVLFGPAYQQSVEQTFTIRLQSSRKVPNLPLLLTEAALFHHKSGVGNSNELLQTMLQNFRTFYQKDSRSQARRLDRIRSRRCFFLRMSYA